MAERFRVPPAARMAACVILAAVAWAGVAAGPPGSLQADDAPGRIVDLDGRPRDLAELGGSIVVVNFWATWCVPCRVEMPVFADIASRHGGAGVVIVGVSADRPEDARKVRRFADDLDIEFPIWLGATTADMTRLGLGTALPATAVLERDGRVAVRIDGVVDGPGLGAWIEWLLGDRTVPAPPVPVATTPATGHEGHNHEDHRHGPGVGLDGPSLVPS